VKRPVSIWLVALLVAGYGGYGLWAAVTVQDWAFAASGVLALLACGGLLGDKPWSQPVVHLLSVLVVGGWSYAVWRVAQLGWPYPGVASTVVSLVPGAVLVVACAGVSVAVYRHFHRP
jgi:hypothetical protein